MSIKLRSALAVVLTSTALSYGQNALSFDGVNDYVDCGNNTSLQITGTGLTIEAWIYANSWETNVWQGTIVTKEQNGAGQDNGFMLRAGGSGQLNLTIGNGTWKDVYSPVNTLSLNTWHHVAGTFNGTTLRLFVDGVQVATASASASISNSSTGVVIGGRSDGARNFDGLIDEVRIWSTVRTGAQLQADMNTEICGSPSSLKAYYQMDQGNAAGNNTNITTLTDRTGNNPAVLANFALTGSASNFVTGVPIQTLATTSSISDTICSGETYALAGQTFSATGSYQITLTGSNGCDSIIDLDLEVKSPVNTIVSRQGYTFTANASGTGYAYQWIKCEDGSAIPGATNQVYVASANGQYAAVISYDGCSDTSACFTVAGIGLEENSLSSLRVYPNPASSVVNVEWEDVTGDVTVQVSDLTGREVYTSVMNDTHTRIDIASWPKGVYVLRVQCDGVSQQMRFVK